MKKMLAICAGMALVCGFSLFAAGCAEHGEMKAMDTGMETMHKDPMTKGMGEMENTGLDKDMRMEEKKEM